MVKRRLIRYYKETHHNRWGIYSDLYNLGSYDLSDGSVFYIDYGYWINI